MLTVFIEYKLDPEKRTQGMLLLRDMAARMESMGARQYRTWEGLDQPGLFVEAFDVETAQQYEQIKEMRLADRDFCNCVSGEGKLHVWAFRPAEL
ncbi:hypothetical protein [Brevibacillus sp. NRS-1366]|uniref:hypothetical protein n=1 Tax=Brevibacillus sp. NRS-1366 TaxID=3233899 RepID=UPI003D1D9BE5